MPTRRRTPVRKPFPLTTGPFWARVSKTDTCWLWTGKINDNGYGTLHDYRAHRIAYEMLVGPIPEGLLVCHHCDVRNCVRPDHLFVGTHSDNSQDMVSKGRHTHLWQAPSHCKHGHEFTPENTYKRPNGKSSCIICTRRRTSECYYRRQARLKVAA